MTALTRILNNQIFDNTIVGYQKISPGTITGSLFSSNVTVPGDLLISGNLFVLGSSAYTTIASTNTYVNDPLITLNNGFSGTNTRDIGLILNRGTYENKAIIWSEANKEFRLIGTTETGTTYGNIVTSSYANLHIGNLTVDGTLTLAELIVSSISLPGNVLANTVGASFVTASSATFGNIAAGNIGNVGTRFIGDSINITGNILASAAVFNNATVNGNTTISGFLNVTGNVLGSNGTFNGLDVNGIINASGNILGSAATFVSADVNGLLNVSANILSTGLTVFGNTSYGVVGAISGQWHNFVGNIDQTTSGGPVYINTSGNILALAGHFGSINSTGHINTTGNVSTAQLDAGQVNTTGNVLAAGGVFNSLTVNGDEAVTGNLNVTGNILAAELSVGLMNISGNILAAAAVFNGLTVNGNAAVTGDLNVTGNVLADIATLNILGVSNNLWANASIDTTTQGQGAIVIPNGGISVAGNANVAGRLTTGAPAQFNNSVTIGGITYFDNTTNTTGVNSGALQIAGGASISKDLWVNGNIYAANIIGVNEQIITVQDPLLYLTAANIYPYNYDIGIFSQFIGPKSDTGTGNVYQHTGLVRDNSDYTWKFFSNIAAEPTGTIPFDADTIYDPVLAGNLRLTFTQAATSTTDGALQVAGGAGIAGTVVAGNINSTGNVIGQTAVFNNLSLNGNQSITGYLNVTGNVLADAITANSINTAGNILATDVTFNSATVNGLINSSANILAAGLSIFGNVDLGIAGAVSGSWINVVGNITQTTAGGPVYINTTGNVSAAVGDFGSINSTGYINTTGNISTAQLNAGQINTTGNLLATAGVLNSLTVNGNGSVTGNLNVTGNVSTAQLDAGQINTTGNVLATAGVFNVLTVNGNQTISGNINAAGNISGATADFATVNVTSLINATGNVVGTSAVFNALTVNGNETVTGNLGVTLAISADTGNITSSAISTSSTTGALVVAGGVGFGSNLNLGGGAVINYNSTHQPFQVKGNVTTSLIYADSTYGAVIIGGSNTAPQLGATLKVNSSDSMLIPVGSTGQRPGATGNVDVTGMMRFNTTVNNLEFYDGTAWQLAGGNFTVVTDRQISGNTAYGNVDGVNTVFTIQGNSTTAGTVVSINGVIQFPVLSYSVSGTTLTFTEAPAANDVIDIRVLTTTTAVNALTNGNGLQQFIASDTAAEIWTGTGSTTKQIEINKVGDLALLTGQKVTYTQPAHNIAANNTPYVISTWDQTAFTSAKLVISAKKDSTNVETMEALVVTDGVGNAYVTTYATINNGTAMGNITANVVSGNVRVYYTTLTNMINANVKAQGTFIV